MLTLQKAELQFCNCESVIWKILNKFRRKRTKVSKFEITDNIDNLQQSNVISFTYSFQQHQSN